MLGLSQSVWLRHAAATAALLALLSATACTSDDTPTAAQAGQTLKTHILQLLKEREALDVKITDSGGKNIPCENGKVKQTFAATGEDAASTTSPENMRSVLLGALERVGSYKIINVGPLTKPVQVVNSSARTMLVLDSPARGEYAVSGQTECLAS